MGNLPLLMHLGLVAALGRFLRRRRCLGGLLGGSFGLLSQVDRAPTGGHREFVYRRREGANARFFLRLGDSAGLALPRRLSRDATVAELVPYQLA